MNEQDRNDFYIHPTVLRILRLTGTVLVLLAVYLSAKVAITFCLGLFAGGNHVVQLPWQESPIVSLEDHAASKNNYIDPSQLAEVARTDLVVAGDVMLHMPIVRTSQTMDGYDFDPIFSHVAPYISSAGYAVVNLETTLSGTEGKEFTGSPNFNSPDAIVRSLKTGGFDMLLTGNNHCYDYGTDGLKRTLSVLQSHDLASLGTVDRADAPRHTVKSVGGISVGMLCYTFGDIDDIGSVTINAMTTDSSGSGLINAFDYDNLSRFYTEIEGELLAMRGNGAEISVIYIHWGDEYSTVVSDTQREIAQKLCDLGVDVIIGSHPHVVQPLDLLTSSADPAHTTICLYSAGTLLSNLRADIIGMPTSHCEDGVLLNLTLSKLNDGTARVSSVKVLPTWVQVQGTGETRDFFILPLDQTVSNWQDAYGLSADQLSDAKASYNRTMELVTPGLNKISNYLISQNAALDPDLGVG